MKKKIIIIFIMFFAFITPIYAKENVNSVDINITIDESGSATITEEWIIKQQQNKLFTRKFHNVKDMKISDIKIIDNLMNSYDHTNSIKTIEDNKYYFDDGKYSKYLYFQTDGTDKDVIVQYKINNIVTKFKDKEALNWTVFSSVPNQEIGNLNIYVSSSLSLTELNTVLYAIGKNITGEIKDGKIHLFQSFINNESDVIMLASISELKFKKYLKNDMNMSDYYRHISKKSSVTVFLEDLLHEHIHQLVIVCIIIIILIIIINAVIKIVKRKDQFHNFVTFNKNRTLGDMSQIPYHDAIPCGGDLYKIDFYSNIYNISKSRSNLIGAIIMKWIFDGILTIQNSDDKYSILIKDNQVFDRDLDLELYNILKSASSNLILDNNKLLRYAEENSKQVMDWYDAGITQTVRDEYLKRNILLKRNKMVMNKITEDDAFKVQGLKRYLLNFNQVPRQTELNEQVYKYLIICSILLGVDETLGKEILRKNPDNELAKQLIEYQKIKPIYQNIYSKTCIAFKKAKYKKNKMLYNPSKKI